MVVIHYTRNLCSVYCVLYRQYLYSNKAQEIVTQSAILFSVRMIPCSDSCTYGEQSHTPGKYLNCNNTNCTKQKQFEKWEIPEPDYFTYVMQLWNSVSEVKSCCWLCGAQLMFRSLVSLVIQPKIPFVQSYDYWTQTLDTIGWSFQKLICENEYQPSGTEGTCSPAGTPHSLLA